MDLIGGDSFGVAPGSTLFSVRVLDCSSFGTANTKRERDQLSLTYPYMEKRIYLLKEPLILFLELEYLLLVLQEIMSIN